MEGRDNAYLQVFCSVLLLAKQTLEALEKKYTASCLNFARQLLDRRNGGTVLTRENITEDAKFSTHAEFVFHDTCVLFGTA